MHQSHLADLFPSLFLSYFIGPLSFRYRSIIGALSVHYRFVYLITTFHAASCFLVLFDYYPAICPIRVIRGSLFPSANPSHPCHPWESFPFCQSVQSMDDSFLIILFFSFKGEVGGMGHAFSDGYSNEISVLICKA